MMTDRKAIFKCCVSNWYPPCPIFPFDRLRVNPEQTKVRRRIDKTCDLW